MSDVPSSACLACGYVCDAVTCATRGNDVIPDEGCLTICLRCGHLMAFDAELQLRDLTDEEMYKIAGRKDLIAVQKARAAVMKSREEWP